MNTLIEPNTEEKVTTAQIEEYAPIIAGMLDYLRWLAEQNTSFPITAGQVWALYWDGVRVGRSLQDVCVDLGLPERDEWY